MSPRLLFMHIHPPVNSHTHTHTHTHTRARAYTVFPRHSQRTKKEKYTRHSLIKTILHLSRHHRVHLRPQKTKPLAIVTQPHTYTHTHTKLGPSPFLLKPRKIQSGQRFIPPSHLKTFSQMNIDGPPPPPLKAPIKARAYRRMAAWHIYKSASE